jgi:hypothetical protein
LLQTPRAGRRDLRQLLDSAEMSPGKALHFAYEKSGTQVKTNQHNCLRTREAKEFSPVKLLPCETGSSTKIAERDPSQAN